ncbi:hypothetical protein NBM05_06720 [Rothia sp. AR01]|uniref:Methyltransferase n=1 Tax=Rothia santali TaxID=2949643 RepID=A0A9X2HK13_9MICC|nr:hypothetical protein [Rothia santali]MCP3425713.1 hypothetical protein [Rothia santali]
MFVEAFAGVAPVAAAVQRAAPGAEVHATDLDDVVLERHARSNLSPAAGVHAGSVLEGLPAALGSRVDVIAAVPPYIPVGASELLPREARDHEPGAALYGGSDGLDLVRAVLAQAPGWLRPGGRLLLEMNRGQCSAATESAGRLGYASFMRLGDDGQTAVLDLRSAAP